MGSVRGVSPKHLSLLLDEFHTAVRSTLPDAPIAFPLSQAEMACLIGVTPEHMSRILQHVLADGRLVRVGRRLYLRARSRSATC
jgi:hypothetical protein